MPASVMIGDNEERKMRHANYAHFADDPFARLLRVRRNIMQGDDESARGHHLGRNGTENGWQAVMVESGGLIVFTLILIFIVKRPKSRERRPERLFSPPSSLHKMMMKMISFCKKRLPRTPIHAPLPALHNESS